MINSVFPSVAEFHLVYGRLDRFRGQARSNLTLFQYLLNRPPDVIIGAPTQLVNVMTFDETLVQAGERRR
mgnify:CR=1 FL=1